MVGYREAERMAIPPEDMEVGGIYRLKARNLTVGVWTGHTFIGIREKFYSKYLDEAEVPYTTAFPLEKIGMVPEGVKLQCMDWDNTYYREDMKCECVDEYAPLRKVLDGYDT